MNPETEKRVRHLQRAHPDMALRYLLSWARTEPIYMWTGRGHGDAMVAEFGARGYDVRAQVTPDYNAEPGGLFTDKWQEGAIQNPSWRPNMPAYDSVYRWFVPESGETVESLAEWNRRTMGRHDAWLAAVRTLLEDFERDCKRTNSVTVSVEVSKAGIRLGTAAIYTDLADDMRDTYGKWFDVDPYVDDLIPDLLAEALHEADTAVKALCDCPTEED